MNKCRGKKNVCNLGQGTCLLGIKSTNQPGAEGLGAEWRGQEGTSWGDGNVPKLDWADDCRVIYIYQKLVKLPKIGFILWFLNNA